MTIPKRKNAFGGPRDQLIAFKINKLERDWLVWRADYEGFQNVSEMIRAVLAGYCAGTVLHAVEERESGKASSEQVAA